VLNQLIVPIPAINIYGASISSLACYIISMIPNVYYVKKYAGLSFDWKAFVIKPGISTIAMGVLVWGAMQVLPERMISTIILVVIGIVGYVIFSLLFQSFTLEDVSFLRIKKKRRH
ncbi:MAG: hypothetical protein GX786_11190, partial [Clostridiales bacterium]|nr:hypothetical protein [Clostridiales bacterium]